VQDTKTEEKYGVEEKVDYLVSSIKHNVNIAEKATLDFIGSLLNLENPNILESEIVKRFTEICWRKAEFFLKIQGIVWLMLTLLLSLHIIFLNQYKDEIQEIHRVVVAFLILFELFYIAVTTYALVRQRLHYFKNIWGCLDLIIFFIIGTYIVAYMNESLHDNISFILWLGTWFAWFRLISFLRLYDTFRYYIRLIFQVIKGIRTFIAITFMFVVGTSFGLMAMRQAPYLDA